MVESTDLESISDWLQEQDHQTQIWFATRNSLRVLPVIGLSTDESVTNLSFACLRATIISAAASTCPETDVESFRLAAYSAATIIASSTRAANFIKEFESVTATHTATVAAIVASIAAYTTVPPTIEDDSSDILVDTVARAATTVRRIDLASGAAGGDIENDAISFDCSTPMLWDKLWPMEDQPDAFLQGWENLKLHWQLDDADWSFWVEWYEGILAGKPLSWELTQRIALEITTDEWEAGQIVVGERIREIKNDWLMSQLPQHEVLSEDPETGKFEVTAAPFDDQALVDGNLKQVEFSLSLAVDSNTSDFNRMCMAFKYLQHTLENCRNDPNAIEQNLGIAKNIILENLNNPDYLADDSLRALAITLEQHQLQIRADHPDVRKAWEKRIAQRMREVDRDTKLIAAKAIQAEQARVQGNLAVETDLDAETVAGDVSEEAQATALRRATGRSAKMNVLTRV
ncbi:MAG: hypothetical protein P8Q99_08965 [Paracoccaceae bacterium]|nr:hypothetical protein [Paracoccaceae bacterium]